MILTVSDTASQPNVRTVRTGVRTTRGHLTSAERLFSGHGVRTAHTHASPVGVCAQRTPVRTQRTQRAHSAQRCTLRRGYGTQVITRA